MVLKKDPCEEPKGILLGDVLSEIMQKTESELK